MQEDRGTTPSLLREAASLLEEAATAAAAGRQEDAQRALDQADRLTRRARRGQSAQSEQPDLPAEAEVRATGPDKPPRLVVLDEPAQDTSTREIVIGALDALGVPAAPRDIAHVARARFNVAVDPRALGSLRRDERRAWANPRTVRSTYICVALDAKRLVPYRGLLTLSSWDLPRRLITPLSPRVDHLRATGNLVRLLAWLRGVDAEAAGRLELLVRRYAATIPGAGSGSGPIDTEQVAAAAAAELELLESEDTAERLEAAERARARLDEEALIWGAPLKVLRGSG
jgi:hypothetical protein